MNGEEGDGAIRPVELLLFVAPASPTTATADRNLRASLSAMNAERFELEVVNVAADPFRALDLRVLITPTLLAPASGRRLVGDFSEPAIVEYFLASLLTDG